MWKRPRLNKRKDIIPSQAQVADIGTPLTHVLTATIRTRLVALDLRRILPGIDVVVGINRFCKL